MCVDSTGCFLVKENWIGNPGIVCEPQSLNFASFVSNSATDVTGATGNNVNPVSLLHRTRKTICWKTCWRQMLRKQWSWRCITSKQWKSERWRWSPVTCGEDRASLGPVWGSAASREPMSTSGTFWWGAILGWLLVVCVTLFYSVVFSRNGKYSHAVAQRKGTQSWRFVWAIWVGTWSGWLPGFPVTVTKITPYTKQCRWEGFLCWRINEKREEILAWLESLCWLNVIILKLGGRAERVELNRKECLCFWFFK